MLRAGHRIGPYELLSPIGAGGMGEVWKARDKRLVRIVAIKFSQAAFTDRFQQEARAIAALNHPNIATLYDVGPDYLVINAFGASCAWAADGGTIYYRGATGARAVSADGKNVRPVYSSGRGVFGLLPSGELLIAQARGTPPVATLMRVDPMSGKLISSVPLALPEGYSPLMATLAVHPSGKKIVISTSKASIDLFPIQGFAQPENGWRRVFGHWQTPPVSKEER